MKTIFLIFLFTADLFAQDLLINPQNQKYLFTAGSDETQAFLYNPAYLGLHGRETDLDAYYFYPASAFLNQVGDKFHDFGAFVQGGKFGLSYRNAGGFGENLNQYSVGIGFGSASFAGGASLSLTNISGFGTRWFPSVGLVWRPDRYLSLGVAYHNFTTRPFGFHPIEERANFGVSIRPFGTEFLTLSGDLMTPAHTDGYKLGAELEVIPGLKLYGIYDRSGFNEVSNVAPANADPAQYALGPIYYWQPTSLSLGISFDFSPHILVEGQTSYQSPIAGTSSGRYAATYGRIMITPQYMSTIMEGKDVAQIVIKGNIHDAPEPWTLFFRPQKTLLDYVSEIRKCGDNPSIKALILKIYPFSTNEAFFALSGEAQELADAVKYVREKGKKVYAYLADDTGVDELYLASAANEVYMAPVTFISGYGINFDLIRLKGLFDKLHIGWNVETAGKYKSTFHTEYTDSATPDQAKLIKGLVENVYSQMIKQIEVNRHLSVDEKMKNEISGLISARRAADVRLIDGVEYFSEFEKKVNKEVHGYPSEMKPIDPGKVAEFPTYWCEKPEVAVIGVFGLITTGESSAPAPFPIPFLGGDRTTGSETVVDQIRKAGDNGNIKAIVLRVNSGGGSALASDQIYNAIKDAERKKPVVASFGNVAASGGYYVAAGTQRIFAEPATLTGSIGVLIEFPVLTDFLQKDLGANLENYQEGKNSDLLSPFHRWTPEDLKYIDRFLDETYTDFERKVAEGRRLTMNRVEELAQGKVYTGDQAKGDSLIDGFGGIETAIKYAADLAHIKGDYRIKVFTVPGAGLGSIFNIAAWLTEVSSRMMRY